MVFFVLERRSRGRRRSRSRRSEFGISTIDRRIRFFSLFSSSNCRLHTNQNDHAGVIPGSCRQVQRAVARGRANPCAHALLQQPRDGLGVALTDGLAEVGRTHSGLQRQRRRSSYVQRRRAEGLCLGKREKQREMRVSFNESGPNASSTSTLYLFSKLFLGEPNSTNARRMDATQCS